MKKNFRCLIIEDNANAAEIMSIFFERNGIASDTAGNGQAGLQMYFDEPLKYDIVFLDLQMPVMDGFEVAKRVRKSGMPNAGTIPIAAMSGTITSGVTKGGAFNYFLKKPFQMRCLTEIINETGKQK
jgi:CheY-like chemotaxis protein